jgi:hypothetical protein
MVGWSMEAFFRAQVWCFFHYEGGWGGAEVVVECGVVEFGFGGAALKLSECPLSVGSGQWAVGELGGANKLKKFLEAEGRSWRNFGRGMGLRQVMFGGWCLYKWFY